MNKWPLFASELDWFCDFFQKKDLANLIQKMKFRGVFQSSPHLLSAEKYVLIKMKIKADRSGFNFQIRNQSCSLLLNKKGGIQKCLKSKLSDKYMFLLPTLHHPPSPHLKKNCMKVRVAVRKKTQFLIVCPVKKVNLINTSIKSLNLKWVFCWSKIIPKIAFNLWKQTPTFEQTIQGKKMNVNFHTWNCLYYNDKRLHGKKLLFERKDIKLIMRLKHDRLKLIGFDPFSFLSNQSEWLLNFWI